VMALSVGRLGMRRKVKEGSSECGAERRRRECILYGRGGGGEAAAGGGVLLLVGFEGVKGERGDGRVLTQWGK
jgi:hypothetical protein